MSIGQVMPLEVQSAQTRGQDSRVNFKIHISLNIDPMALYDICMESPECLVSYKNSFIEFE